MALDSGLMRREPCHLPLVFAVEYGYRQYLFREVNWVNHDELVLLCG